MSSKSVSLGDALEDRNPGSNLMSGIFGGEALADLKLVSSLNPVGDFLASQDEKLSERIASMPNERMLGFRSFSIIVCFVTLAKDRRQLNLFKNF